MTLMLGERRNHERIAQCSEPYPGRFTHHLMVGTPEEVDEQLMDWVQQSHAYRFMLTGGKARN